MDFSKCSLNRIIRKRDLYNILGFDKESKKKIAGKYKICIEDGKRLLEKPRGNIKEVQSRILTKLYELEYPPYLFSGLKRKMCKGQCIISYKC